MMIRPHVQLAAARMTWVLMPTAARIICTALKPQTTVRTFTHRARFYTPTNTTTTIRDKTKICHHLLGNATAKYVTRTVILGAARMATTLAAKTTLSTALLMKMIAPKNHSISNVRYKKYFLLKEEYKMHVACLSNLEENFE